MSFWYCLNRLECNHYLLCTLVGFQGGMFHPIGSRNLGTKAFGIGSWTCMNPGVAEHDKTHWLCNRSDSEDSLGHHILLGPWKRRRQGIETLTYCSAIAGLAN